MAVRALWHTVALRWAAASRNGSREVAYTSWSVSHHKGFRQYSFPVSDTYIITVLWLTVRCVGTPVERKTG
ncbi:hypothetical protein C8Q74DRAFT_1302602 [Fomes fomentarius]|nr:hypothetical protein C8Q74DRAFT_1302602 [Fomes fomentarius]